MSPLTREELRKKLIEKYMEVAFTFYFEGSEEQTERKEYAPKFADDLMSLFDTYSDKKEGEWLRLLAAILAQEGGDYIVQKRTLVDLPTEFQIDRMDSMPGIDGIVYTVSLPKQSTDFVEGLRTIEGTYDLPRPTTTLPKNFDPSTITTNGSLNHGEK